MPTITKGGDFGKEGKGERVFFSKTKNLGGFSLKLKTFSLSTSQPKSEKEKNSAKNIKNFEIFLNIIKEKRVRGVEPPSLPWQGSVIAVILHPRLRRRWESNPRTGFYPSQVSNLLPCHSAHSSTKYYISFTTKFNLYQLFSYFCYSQNYSPYFFCPSFF